MPIYEFECAKCGKRLEIITSSAYIPKLCGRHCVAEDRAGDGDLVRKVSVPARLTPARGAAIGKNDPDTAARHGFTTFKRRGKGQYDRVAGTLGPDHIDARDD